MPLLNRAPFHPVDLPEDLQPEEKVYYCDATGEIFRSYDAYAGRKIQLDTEVWSCEITGKSSLTYEDAIDSEKNAKTAVKKIDKRLIRAILFLVNKATGRTVFNKLSNEIFAVIKDIYFIGERIKHSGKRWQVIEMKSTSKKSENQENLSPGSALKYEYILEFMNDKGDAKQIRAKSSEIRNQCRPFFTKPMLNHIIKMHTKQCEEDRSYVLLPESQRKYKVNVTKWVEIFMGPEPAFEKLEPKLVKKAPEAKKVLTNKVLQAMSVQKAEDEEKKRRDQTALKERHAKAKAAYKEAEKEWLKIKSDETLSDLKTHKLPAPARIETPLPQKFLGDSLSLCEFFHTFHDHFSSVEFDTKIKTFSLQDCYEMLTEKCTNGVFCDVLMYLLDSIRKCKESEIEESKSKANPVCRQQDSPFIEEELVCSNIMQAWPTGEAFVADELIDTCTELALFCSRALGDYPIKLGIDEVTVTEVLRLIILSAGANPNNDIAIYRQKYKGYWQNDDEFMLSALRDRSYLQLLENLETQSVFALEAEDRMRLILLMRDSLLGEADARELHEEADEKINIIADDIKKLKKKERETKSVFTAELVKLRLDIEEMKKQEMNPELESKQVEKQVELSEKEALVAARELEFDGEIDGLTAKMQKHTFAFRPIMLGTDRFHRRYMIVAGVPGLLVEVCEDIPPPVGSKTWEGYTLPTFAEKPKYSDFYESTRKTENGTVKDEGDNELTALESTISWSEKPLAEPGFYIYDVEMDVRMVYEGLNERGERERLLKEMIQRHFFLISLEIDRAGSHFYQSGRRLTFEQPDERMETDFFDKEILGVRDFILELEERIFKADFGDLNSEEEKRQELREFFMRRDLVRSIDFISGLQEGSDMFESFEDQRPVKATNRIPIHLSDEEITDNVFEVRNLAASIVAMSRVMRKEIFLRPMGIESKKSKKGYIKDASSAWKAVYSSQKKHWETSILAVRSPSALMLHLMHFDECINWDQSVENLRCSACRKKGDADNMLICETCERGFHTYCHKPKVRRIPIGDWFCQQCKIQQAKESSPKKTRRRSNIFDIDEELELRPRKRAKVDYTD